jgi:hypothetical protein
MPKYYRVRGKKHPDQNGAVIKISKKKLEVITGEHSPKDFGCYINKRNNKGISVNKKYFLKEISEKTANKLKEDSDYWEMMQLYMGTDPFSMQIEAEDTIRNSVFGGRGY